LESLPYRTDAQRASKPVSEFDAYRDRKLPGNRFSPLPLLHCASALDELDSATFLMMLKSLIEKNKDPVGNCTGRSPAPGAPLPLLSRRKARRQHHRLADLPDQRIAKACSHDHQGDITLFLIIEVKTALFQNSGQGVKFIEGAEKAGLYPRLYPRSIMQ
jgi:hypothetical protein